MTFLDLLGCADGCYCAKMHSELISTPYSIYSTPSTVPSQPQLLLASTQLLPLTQLQPLRLACSTCVQHTEVRLASSMSLCSKNISVTALLTSAIPLCLPLHCIHYHTCTHPAAHRDVGASAAQAISITLNSMPSCSTCISTTALHAMFALPCIP